MAITFTPIPVPSIPASLLIDGTEPDFLKALKYRTQINQYGQAFLNVIAQYQTDFSTNLDELVMPASSGDEESALDELHDESKDLLNDFNSIKDAILTALNQDLATDPVDFDVQALVDTIIGLINKELDTGTEDIPIMRALLKSIVDLALLDSSYSILSSEDSQITTAVNAFIARAKSELDDKMVRIERQTINQLDLDGVLDTDIASEVLTRGLADKGRQYTEIDNQAEELRIKLLGDAWDRAIERVKTKVQAGGIIPTDMVRIPDQFYGLLGDLVRRKFWDRNAFINNYPNIVNNALEGLADVARIRQNDRHVSANYTLDVGKTILELYGLMSRNLQSIAGSVAKMGTFEAS